MKVPKYIQEILSRSKYEFDFETSNEYYASGYTVRVTKPTPYTLVPTFKKELDRLCEWVNKSAGCVTAHILYVPTETHHVNQYAVVTIFDPIMKHIEGYIHHA